MFKKIDIYLLKNFLGLFLVTLFMCIFILLMQFVWMHVKDLVGKGVEIKVLMEFFIYAVASVMQLALPLATLLASIISFGNLGEKVELTAMKAAGIGLFRILRPLAIAVTMISLAALGFSNYILPASQVKLWALIFSLRQKNPELDIPIGEFYDGIQGYNVYVKRKNVRTGMLYDLMIYDYSKGFQDATVMVADSGKIFFTDDKKYLLLCLYSGESFENLDQQQRRATRTVRNVPYRRESFDKKQLLIDFDTDLNRFDDAALMDQHIAKDIGKLVHSIDSAKVLADDKKVAQSRAMVDSHYFGRERVNSRSTKPLDEGDVAEDYSLEELYESLSISKKARAYTTALEKARSQKDLIEYNAILLDEHNRYIRKHEIELYRKFTLSFACLIFFFIGAPLGAITRKGGLGAPVVIAVVMFIIYYIIDNAGWQQAREGIWPCWAGMWLSSFALIPIAAFLTYKAATDSALFNTDVWIRVSENIWNHTKSLWKKLRKQ